MERLPASSEGKKRVPWFVLSVEAFLIIVSVLLALGLNEWRQGKADRDLVRAVLDNVQGEIQRNRDLLQRRLPYHETMLDSTGGFLNSNMEGGPDGLRLEQLPRLEQLGIDSNKGLATAGRFTDTGWRLALNSGALKFMDYDVMKVLSETYAKQEETERQEERLGERLGGLFQGYFGEGIFGAALVTFSAALTDMVLREQELLKQYDSALETISQ